MIIGELCLNAANHPDYQFILWVLQYSELGNHASISSIEFVQRDLRLGSTITIYLPASLLFLSTYRQMPSSLGNEAWRVEKWVSVLS